MIVGGDTSRAHVFAEVFSAAPQVSGTLLEARLHESYDRRDGSVQVGAVSRQDIAAYRVSVTSGQGPGVGEGILAAHFAVGPSLTVPLSVLEEGRIRIDTVLPEASEPVLLGPDGGTVGGPEGIELVVPPGAAGAGTIVTLGAAAPSDLPAGVSPLTSFVLGVSGGGLDPAAEYRLNPGASVSVNDGDAFVVGRTAFVAGRIVLRAVAFGRGEAGLVVVKACETFDATPICLPGLAPGAHAIFAVPGGIAAAAGTVLDPSSAPAADLVVESASIPVVGITSASGTYALPIPAGVGTSVQSRDASRDLTGTTPIAPTAAGSLASADIELEGTPPEVTDIVPANHAGAVLPDSVITVTFSEAIAAASLVPGSVTLTRAGVAATGQGLVDEQTIAVRLSLTGAGTQLVVNAGAPLESDSLYRLTLTDAITDLSGHALRRLLPGAPAAFVSDFTTAAVFQAEALPPDTFRVSLPEDGAGTILPVGAAGEVFICGGPQLASPGTDVVVTNRASGLSTPVTATDEARTSYSEICDTHFLGRCNTSEPGSFCVVLTAVAGDRFDVQVEDALGNIVTLDAGNMRDERTGAEVVGPDGGIVTFPGDERYRAMVPEGAFLEPAVVQVTPIDDGGAGLQLADFPVLTSFDQEKVELVGALRLDVEGEALRNIDITVPAPAGAAAADQYIATRAVDFRGIDEQTMVDLATFDSEACTSDADNCVVATGFISGFPLIFGGGIFGIHHAFECIAFATGFVAIGDLYNAGYLPGGVPGALLPFPIATTDRVQFALPVPCNQPVQVEIRTFDEQPIDDVPCGAPSILDRGQVCELLEFLTDDTRPPQVQDASVPDGESGVNPLGQLSVTFDESMDPGSIDTQTCEVVGSDGPIKGSCKLSNQNRVLTFVPEVRLKYGEQYSFRINGVRDGRGQVLSTPFASTFNTFAPRILRRIDVDAQDVVWIDAESAGFSSCDDLVAVAEGDATQPDYQGGMSIYDVTDLGEPPTRIAFSATAGVDRALTFVGAEPLVTTGQGGGSFSGPYLMSVDGPGGPDRFGVWRIFDLSELSEGRMVPVATRLINQSANSWRQLNLEDPQGILLGTQLELIPNDVGVPLDIAAFGTQISYIANTPNIGLQAIVPQGLDATPLSTPQVGGTLLGVYRAVSTLKNRVLAVRQDGSANHLVMVDAQLGAVRDTHVLPNGGRPLAVIGLNDWPSRLAFGDEEQSPRDLAVVMCPNSGVCVVAADPTAGKFQPGLLDNGVGMIETPGGNPRGAVGDPLSQLLLVADGTAGLTVIDLAVPGGSRDGNHDGIDDRVLATVDLNGAVARQVALFRDTFGALIGVVGTGTGGVYLVQLGTPTLTASTGTMSAAFMSDPPTEICEDMRVRRITAASSAGNNSPQIFEGQMTEFGDPCSRSDPAGQALFIPRNAVSSGPLTVNDFDIALNATVFPASLIPELVPEHWAKVAGSSGSFDANTSFAVKFRNPKVGGLYQFTFTLGIGEQPSGANVLLPLAGADIIDWLQDLLRTFPAWVSAVKEGVEAAADAKAIGVCSALSANNPVLQLFEESCRFQIKEREALFAFAELGAHQLDFALQPHDDTHDAPCARYAGFPGSAQYGFVTVNGVVVHGSKVANMLYGAFGRQWGWAVGALRTGAYLNQFKRLNEGLRAAIDSPSSQSGVILGAQLIDQGVATGPTAIGEVLTPSAVAALQIEESGDALSRRQRELWPAPKKAHLPNSLLDCPPPLTVSAEVFLDGLFPSVRSRSGSTTVDNANCPSAP